MHMYLARENLYTTYIYTYIVYIDDVLSHVYIVSTDILIKQRLLNTF